jgi:hypothetical protein
MNVCSLRNIFAFPVARKLLGRHCGCRGRTEPACSKAPGGAAALVYNFETRYITSADSGPLAEADYLTQIGTNVEIG